MLQNFKQSARNLLHESSKTIQIFLDAFDTILTDCDGVLWYAETKIDGSVEALRCLQNIGKKVYLCTNNSTKTRKELQQKALRLGYNVEENEMISTAHSTARYLKKLDFNKKVYVIGMEGIVKELDSVGISHSGIGPDPLIGTLSDYLENQFCLEKNIGAVVVGFDCHFSFPKIAKSISYLLDPKCLFLATNTDECFPMTNGMLPGSGVFVRAIEVCAGRLATVIGKPNPALCKSLIDRKLIEPSRTLMIGDRCNTDVLFGYNCGFYTLLVGTGIHNLKDVADFKNSNDPEIRKLIPDFYLPQLADVLKLF